TGFVTGLNTLRLIANNTGVTPITAPTATFASPSGDATTALVNASVTYNVPEPSSAVLLLTGAFLSVRRRLLRTNDRNR
ncbi:MAG: PEP-CTERM sorting domain-containing protein, partial [Chthoniobacteraceae bacterium]